MRDYLQSWWVRVGLVMMVLGTGPLLAIIVAAELGFLDDPNPNPVGPGILCGLTFWPSVLCVVIGVVRVRRARKRALLASLKGT